MDSCCKKISKKISSAKALNKTTPQQWSYPSWEYPLPPDRLRFRDRRRHQSANTNWQNTKKPATRRCSHIDVSDVQQRRHDEGRGPHNRRQQHPARRCTGLNPPATSRAIPDLRMAGMVSWPVVSTLVTTLPLMEPIRPLDTMATLAGPPAGDPKSQTPSSKRTDRRQ